MALPLIRTLFDSVGPNPWVVRLAFKSKGIRLLKGKAFNNAVLKDGPYVERHQLRLVDQIPENRHSSMLIKNAAGTTPFIELEDGTCLSESVAICEYLDACYPTQNSHFLTGGPTAMDKARTTMWTQRIQLGITQPFQRQYQYGEGAPYFKQHVPWVEASIPAVAGLRKQTTDTLTWLENTMQDNKNNGLDTGFIASSTSYTIPDLQLFCTAKFMSNDKVNVAKLTNSFNPAKELGPWLNDWYKRMDDIVQELDAK